MPLPICSVRVILLTVPLGLAKVRRPSDNLWVEDCQRLVKRQQQPVWVDEAEQADLMDHGLITLETITDALTTDLTVSEWPQLSSLLHRPGISELSELCPGL